MLCYELMLSDRYYITADYCITIQSKQEAAWPDGNHTALTQCHIMVPTTNTNYTKPAPYTLVPSTLSLRTTPQTTHSFKPPTQIPAVGLWGLGGPLNSPCNIGTGIRYTLVGAVGTEVRTVLAKLRARKVLVCTLLQRTKYSFPSPGVFEIFFLFSWTVSTGWAGGWGE